MSEKKKILAISGSIRGDSANMQLLRLFAAHTEQAFEVEFDSGLERLPFFNPDTAEGQLPAEVGAFRAKIAAADGVVICTPEYVFSLPGMLKNALEWTVASVVFSGKPAALITASAVGEKTHESLLLVMQTLGVKLGEHCALHIPGVRSKFKNGAFSDAVTAAAFERLIDDFKAVLQT